MVKETPLSLRGHALGKKILLGSIGNSAFLCLLFVCLCAFLPYLLRSFVRSLARSLALLVGRSVVIYCKGSESSCLQPSSLSSSLPHSHSLTLPLPIVPPPGDSLDSEFKGDVVSLLNR